MRQLLQSGHIKEVRGDDSGGQREMLYKASIVGLVEGLIWEDDCWNRIDDLASDFAEEIPSSFGGRDLFVESSRTGTLKILAEAILESTRDWMTVGIRFVSELSEAPLSRKGRKRQAVESAGLDRL